MTLDIELARRNMIDNQVRPWDVVDPVVLDALCQVRREDFVPQAWRHLAFCDLMLPLGHGEVMMKPVVEGRLLQALQLKPSEQVLEIGTGSGHLAACMARLAAHVHSIEIHQDLADDASRKLAAAGIGNVEVQVADALREFKPTARYDAVVVTGAVETLPAAFLEWLKPGGRLFHIGGHSPVMQALLTRRENSHGWREQSLFDTDLPYLVHARPAPVFQF